MQHTQKSLLHRLAQAVTLMALAVLIQGMGRAQTLAFQPGFVSLEAGDPASPATGLTITPSPATYVGPAAGLLPKGNFASVVTDKSGNIFLSEGATGNIVRVIASGYGPIPVLPSVAAPQAGYVYTVFGTGVTDSSGTVTINPVSSSCTSATGETDAYGDGCLATQAVYDGTVKVDAGGLAVDSNGNLYLADYTAGLVRVVYAGAGISGTASNIPGLPTNPQQGYVYAIAGMAGMTGDTGDSGLATAAQIGQPGYIAVDSNGNIFILDVKNQVLRAVSASSSLPGNPTPTVGYIYTIVGNKGMDEDGILASSSAFSNPQDLAVDSNDNLYVWDNNIGDVRVIYTKGSVPGLTSLTPGYIYAFAANIWTVAPTFFTPISAASAQIGLGVGITLDSAGDVYVVDSQKNAVYRIDLSGNLTTVSGPGSYSCTAAVDQEYDGCAADAGSPPNEGFTALALDPQGNIYATDGDAQLHETNVSASSLYFTPGQTQTVAIYNTGSATSPALTLTGFTATSGFTVASLTTLPTGITADCNTASTSTPLTLLPGQSCETQITFLSSTTAATGTLTVTSNSTNATNGTNVIQLTGAAASTGLTATSLFFDGTYPPTSIAAGTLEPFVYQLHASTVGPTGTVSLYTTASSTPLARQSVTGTATNQTVTFSNVQLTVGNDFIYASYSGDTKYQPSTTTQQLIVVNGTPTTTVLMASPTTATTGSPVTLTATVSSSSGNPSDGTVTFKNGNTVIPGSPVAVSGGSALITTTAPSTAGTATYTASYAGSTTYNPSTSNSVAVTVQAPVATTTVISASSTGPADGVPVTFTATVTPASGTTAPTGTLTFYDGGVALAGTSGPLTPSGTNGQATATYTISTLPVGQNTITAVYSGASLFNPSSVSNTVTVTVGLPATTTTVTPATGSITYGSSYTFTVAVAPQVTSNTAPSGTVTFTAGTTNLGSAKVTNGSATFTTTQLPGGSSQVTDTVIATYNDPTNTFASSTGTASVLVTPVGTTTSTPTSSNLNPVSGQTLTLTATVAAIGGSVQPTGTVTFYNGSTTLCSGALTNGSASCSPSLQQGAASITAVYVGGNGFATSTSSALSLNVAPPSASTSTALVASTTTPTTTQPVTFTATVTNTTNGSTGIPTGVVTFQSGSNVLGTGSLNGSGVATFTTTFTNTGMYPVVAIYQGNSSYTGSTSTPSVTVTVTQALAMSTTSLTLSSSAVQQGQNVTFTATVGPNSPVTPSGTVTFYNAGALIPNSVSTLNGGTASFSIATLSAGAYSITAQYSGDANYAMSQSTAVALTVALPTPSFTLSATPSNLTLSSGQSGAAIVTLVPTYGYSGTVALSCGTLPTNVTCSFSPTTLTADGKNDAVQSTLTISTNNGTAQLRESQPFWRGGNTALSAALLFPAGLFALGFIGKRKRFPYLPITLFVLLASGLLAISGCAGGNGGSTTDAAKGAAQITISAAGSAGSQMQTVNISLTVQ